MQQVDQHSRLVAPQSWMVVRFVIGMTCSISVIRIIGKGWDRSLYVDPRVHFSYPGFGWIPRPGLTEFRILVGCVALLGIAFACGIGGRLGSRIISILLLVLFGWIELIDATTYLNHYWFVTLALALMAIGPQTGTIWGKSQMDSRPESQMESRPESPISVHWVWLLRAQVAVVYICAGIAKLHRDWLIDALPLSIWLAARSDLPMIGSALLHPFAATFASVAGAAFDLTIVGFLLVKRTRFVAWCTLVVFHLATGLLFRIGLFPWVMALSATVFFAPDWPHELIRRVTKSTQDPTLATPKIRHVSGSFQRNGISQRHSLLMGIWLAVQVAIPLRHLFVPGDHRWTNEGYRFSWNVLATEKGGRTVFNVVDIADGTVTRTDATQLLTEPQRVAMATDPELIRQTAHLLRADYGAAGMNIMVRVDSFQSLNGRRSSRLIDPKTDLSREPYRVTGQPWILPETNSPSSSKETN